MSAWKVHGERGFSLPQVIAGFVILGVLGAIGTAKLTKVLKQRALQGEARSLAGLIRQTRSVGLKKNVSVGMIFDAGGRRCQVFEDVDGNGKWQSGEPIRDVALGKDLRIGPAKKHPSRGPSGEPVPSTGLVGAWKGSLIFAKDPMSTPNIGSVYLHHANLADWTACLTRSASSHQIQAFVWDGATWRIL